MKINIQIASYRDELLCSTIVDALQKADQPCRLTFTICNQYHDDDKFNDDLEPFRGDSRFHIIDVPHELSEGVCWARNLIQQYFKDETYVLQIDSHTRFVFNWDTILVDMLIELQKTGHKKPILTTYPPHFDPDNFVYCEAAPNMIIFKEFDRTGIFPVAWPAEIPNWQNLNHPIFARFLAGGFLFTLGCFCKEIPNDPALYFLGEEINLAVRAYTFGYDIFHPHLNIVWHYYSRPKSVKHWDDHILTESRGRLAMNKLQFLFSNRGSKINFDWKGYGLGTERSIEDYERYSGIDLIGKRVQINVLNNPIAFSTQYDDGNRTFLKDCVCAVDNVISFPKNLIEESGVARFELHYLANNFVTFKDFLQPDELLRRIESHGDIVKMYVKFSCDQLPDSFALYLYSNSGHVIKKVTARMPYCKVGLAQFNAG